MRIYAAFFLETKPYRDEWMHAKGEDIQEVIRSAAADYNRLTDKEKSHTRLEIRAYDFDTYMDPDDPAWNDYEVWYAFENGILEVYTNGKL